MPDFVRHYLIHLLLHQPLPLLLAHLININSRLLLPPLFFHFIFSPTPLFLFNFQFSLPLCFSKNLLILHFLISKLLFIKSFAETLFLFRNFFLFLVFQENLILHYGVHFSIYVSLWFGFSWSYWFSWYLIILSLVRLLLILLLEVILQIFVAFVLLIWISLLIGHGWSILASWLLGGHWCIGPLRLSRGLLPCWASVRGPFFMLLTALRVWRVRIPLVYLMVLIIPSWSIRWPLPLWRIPGLELLQILPLLFIGSIYFLLHHLVFLHLLIRVHIFLSKSLPGRNFILRVHIFEYSTRLLQWLIQNTRVIQFFNTFANMCRIDLVKHIRQVVDGLI